MKQAFTFEIIGLKELMRNLEELPTVSMRKTAVRNALKKSAAPVKELAELLAPTEKEKKAIKIGTSLKQSQKKGGWVDRSRVTVYVGSSSPLAHLFEFGTTDRYTKKGWARGRMPRKPFFRIAWDMKKNAALKLLSAELREQIYAAARRLAKRAETGKLTKTMIKGLSR